MYPLLDLYYDALTIYKEYCDFNADKDGSDVAVYVLNFALESVSYWQN